MPSHKDRPIWAFSTGMVRPDAWVGGYVSVFCERFWPCKSYRQGKFRDFFPGTRMAILISGGSDPADGELLLVMLVLARHALCT